MTDTERTFRRDVGTLLVGSLIAQVLALLILPVLTRLYEPGDFGLLGKYLALVGALGTLSLLRYDLAIALPEKDEEGVQVLGLCLGVLLVFTVFLVLASGSFAIKFLNFLIILHFRIVHGWCLSGFSDGAGSKQCLHGRREGVISRLFRAALHPNRSVRA